jgi:hypothetical protein
MSRELRFQDDALAEIALVIADQLGQREGWRHPPCNAEPAP